MLKLLNMRERERERERARGILKLGCRKTKFVI
jgi:hypothetical protein